MRLAISMGDPAGIGPEVTLKALAELNRPQTAPRFTPVVFGSVEVMRRDAALLSDTGSLESRIETAESTDAIDDEKSDAIWVIDVAPDVDIAATDHGEGSAAAATLQLAAFEAAVDAVLSDEAAAIVTAPWTKSLFRSIDRHPTGHTELLGERFPDADPIMMLAGPRLRVSLATTHTPIRDVADELDASTLEQTICTTVSSCRDRFGIEHPEIAVCGLNPHAGEDGAIGEEESTMIEPLVERLRGSIAGELHGPLPADTLFMRFRQGDIPFDAVVCMYHDQGLIPLKLLHFGESANITLGLPIIRTSVDHGTAYDIAGEGIADAGSMRYALKTAAEMVSRSHAR